MSIVGTRPPLISETNLYEPRHNCCIKDDKMKNIESVLKLNKIVFDKIEFNRLGFKNDAYICNSRPRRFGKSYAANMLAAYYSKGADSEQMFSGLSIGKTQKKYLNKYDVIHIDVQWFLANCEDKNKVVKSILLRY